MLTTKNEGGKEQTLFPLIRLGFFCFWIAAAAVLAGCMPAGPRALLHGQRLIEQGNYDAAVRELQRATTLLSTNAQAWNYLGLAYHQAGQVTNAIQAYGRALVIDHDLFEAHYNLGSLWLEQNRPDLAKTELVAFTYARSKAPEGWLKLAEAQYRLRDFNGAEKSFNEALRLSPQNPEALNGLGLVQMQRNRPREAAQLFSAALKQQTNYAPALLNLAIVSEQYLNNRPFALEKYREYLALLPHPANWQEVSSVARALETELSPQQRPAVQPQAAPVASNPPAPKPATNPPPRTVAATRPEPPTNAPKSPTVAATPPAASAPSNLPTVRLQPEPVIRAPQEVATAPSTPVVRTTALASASSPVAPPAQTQKRGFFSKLNPLNLLHSSSNSQPPANASNLTASKTTVAPVTTPATFARYSYRSPQKPADGDRAAAERVFAQAVQAQQANRLKEAIQGYRQATQLDPGYFEAYYNLALVLMSEGNWTSALATFETALALRPDSLDARLYFAQALKQANYPLDAANELERLLARYPNDARAHLALGNLYAQQFGEREKAREHYQKVLDLDPRNEQAPAIRDWLWANRR